MYVIGHHAPGKLPVALAIEELQGSSHHLGDICSGEIAGPAARIKIAFDSLGEEFVQTLLPGCRTSLFPEGLLGGGHGCGPLFALQAACPGA